MEKEDLIWYTVEDAKFHLKEVKTLIDKFNNRDLNIGDIVLFNIGGKIFNLVSGVIVDKSYGNLYIEVEGIIHKTSPNNMLLSYHRFLSHYGSVGTNKSTTISEIKSSRTYKPLDNTLKMNEGTFYIKAIAVGNVTSKTSMYLADCLDCNEKDLVLYKSSLKSGINSCRCGKQKYKNVQDMIEQVIKILDNEKDYKFLGNTQLKTGASTWLKLECARHGFWDTTSVSSFLYGTRCPYCIKNNYRGYFKERVDLEDHLYILKLAKDDEVFYKIGRAFNVVPRFTKIRQFCDIIDYSLYTGTHATVWEVEQKVLSTLKNKNYFKDKVDFGGYTECFSIDPTPYVDFTNLKPKEGLKTWHH